MTQVEAVETSAVNLFQKNDLVVLDKRCLKENPNWIKAAMVRPQDVENVVFKVKGCIIKGVNIWYTIEKNGVHIEMVPEEYLDKGTEEKINSVSKQHLASMQETVVTPEPEVDSKEEVKLEEVVVEPATVIPEPINDIDKEVKLEEVVDNKKSKKK